METNLGSTIWYVLKAARGRRFGQGSKESWWQSEEGAQAGRDGGLLGSCSCRESDKVLMLVVAPIRKEQNTFSA